MRRSLQVVSMLLDSTDRSVEYLRGGHGGQGGSGVDGGEESGDEQSSPELKFGLVPANQGPRVGAGAAGSFVGLRRS